MERIYGRSTTRSGSPRARDAHRRSRVLARLHDARRQFRLGRRRPRQRRGDRPAFQRQLPDRELRGARRHREEAPCPTSAPAASIQPDDPHRAGRAQAPAGRDRIAVRRRARQREHHDPPDGERYRSAISPASSRRAIPDGQLLKPAMRADESSTRRRRLPPITATAKATRRIPRQGVRGGSAGGRAQRGGRARIRFRRHDGDRVTLRALFGRDEQEPPHVLLQRRQHRRRAVAEERARRLEMDRAFPRSSRSCTSATAVRPSSAADT